MATDTEAINLGNMRETVRRGWGDLSQPRLKGWQMAWARVTWRWEKELRCQTEMVLVFGNREKVNECTTGWTMSKGSAPRMRLETLTGPWAWQRAVEPHRGVKLLTREQMKASGGLNFRTWKKKSPFRFSLIHRSHLILSLWPCLHPTAFLFFFHSGRTGIYLKF